VSKKSTLPVGVPEPEELALMATKVTLWPNTEGFGVEVTVVVVVAGRMVKVVLALALL
jgi:hypothetical protein